MIAAISGWDVLLGFYAVVVLVTAAILVIDLGSWRGRR